MALKHELLIVLLAAASIVCSCGGSAPEVPDAEEPEPLSVTRWTEKTELFAEYPPLVTGETSRFAIHLTRLDSFQPLTEGTVEVHLRGGGGAPEVFRVDRPSRPGIFGVDVTPAAAGSRELAIVLRAPNLDDEHEVGAVQVYASADAALQAAAAAGDETEGISFLKEQQWSLEFGTAVVTEASLRESIRVPARIEARPGGAADVTAPIGGRLMRVADLTVGAPVSRGQELARLLPPPSAPAERPELERALAEARSSLAFATRDRERAERLTAAGAVPGKRLEDARTVEDQAKARLAAAEARLSQYEAASSGRGGAEGLFVVRSPIAGVIARREATTGTSVAPGAVLFQIVDVAQVHVVGQIPESQAAAGRRSEDAELELPDGERLPAGRLVSLGKVLDPATRTLPITFALDNRRAGLPVGQPVPLHLLTAPTTSGPVLPASALVDDAGRPIVFVQQGGESFERRPVTVGARTGDRVQVVEGVRPGDRVVTRGAYLVRLASLSTTVPAHGHVH